MPRKRTSTRGRTPAKIPCNRGARAAGVEGRANDVNTDATDASQYVYAALPSATSIRLLEILPAASSKFTTQASQPIKCNIVLVDLQNSPSYDALSYTWGDPIPVRRAFQPEKLGSASKCEEILCDGVKMEVTANLYQALLRMRALDESANDLARLGISPAKHLWVDALCIDQNNLAERNAQVAVMSTIYTNADNVIVWLGVEDEFSTKAIKAISKLAKIFDEDKIEKASNYDLCLPSSYSSLEIPRLTSADWLAIYVFFSRNWFRRVWIIQEAAMAQQMIVVCGPPIISWDALVRFSFFLKRSLWVVQLDHYVLQWANFVTSIEPQGSLTASTKARDKRELLFLSNQDRPLVSEVVQIIEGIAESRAGLKNGSVHQIANDAEPSSFVTLLIYHVSSKASDLKDKIYALNSMSYEYRFLQDGVQPLKPDYNKSVEEVYSDAARFILSSTRNLKLLSRFQDPSSSSLKDLPSWVPDISGGGCPRGLDGMRHPWCAAGNIEWEGPYEPTFGCLPVHGALFDVVISKAESFEMFKWTHLLKELPAGYDLAELRLHRKLVEYLLFAKEKKMVPIDFRLHLALAPAGNLKRPQTRLEVLWRTMIMDRYSHQYPAPVECGSYFTDTIDGIIYARYCAAVDRALKQEERWEAELRESLKAFAAWQWILKASTDDSCSSQKQQQQQRPWQNIPAQGKKPNIDRKAPASEINNKPRLGWAQHPFMEKMGAANTARCLFKTRRHYLGNGSCFLQAGDQVWILHGADVPFLLRPRADGTYQLMGDTYVHGIMYGEAVNTGTLNFENIWLS